MERTCQNCGTIFHATPSQVKNGGGKFCSRACYGKHQRVNPHTRRGQVARPRVESTCQACGKSFRHEASKARQFCSRACYAGFKQVEKVCVTCGESFSVPASNSERYTNCSTECKTADTLYRPCKACGTIFRAGTADRWHCSEDCRRPPVMASCAECGKSFRVGPTERRKFCNTRCYRKHTGETEPEANVRRCLESLGRQFLQEEGIPGWRGPVDFLLPDLRLIIEVDEPYWHDKVADRDARKDLHMQSHGYTVVRLAATPFYGDLTDSMVSAVEAAVVTATAAPAASTVASLYPMQLALPIEVAPATA